ncbi:D-alanyl-D-alanine carboxypeptidase [Streptomyces sp. MJP52]|uniref:D-alanyl-D-alanine carboxypeptidase family protein n=1 Tax=Streptomyces sp. MJP52 TaxID=2940555 RepID=UPI00247DA310|nr:D-alanyl-D-alanine carboxypeptidase (penicillin-binding protein 5/6) [Streptomyces sp. MJP52]
MTISMPARLAGPLARTLVVATAAGALLAAAPAAAPAAPAAPAPRISAPGGFVMDARGGGRLFAKAADGRRATGSTAKIMTAVVVLEGRPDLDRKVTVRKAYSDYIVSRNASSARLIVGDRVTVRQLLYGLMLPSGCDAAYALADTFGKGSTRAARVRSFIGRMNATAGRLGMRDSRFDSFDGISNGSTWSTPRDLARLGAHALRNRVFRTVVGTRTYTARTVTRGGGQRTMPRWTNTNPLLGSYRGALGIKTGSGAHAKYCLVFAARRGDRTVVGAVLAAPSAAARAADARRLLDRAFGRAAAAAPARGGATG